ncbi:hypothetical protein L1049_022233 [Liquidambar formosana]|uniref:Protein kinase domain-containing protein n=1 Tax=Liquidambar formosana TaxID=63359 RepID=A0AAP0WPY4_LIQFO
MDEGVGDEAIDVIEGANHQIKESEYLLKPGSVNMLESHEMVIPGEGDCPEGTPSVFANMLEGKNLDRTVRSIAALEHHPLASPRSMDDAGVMVEELTLRNYNSASLAVVGPSNTRERMQTRQNQWQHLYQLAGGSGSGSSLGDAVHRDNGQAALSAWEDVGYSSFPEFLGKKPSGHDHNEVTEQLTNSENKGCSANTLSPGGIRTKILSKSGFSEFFVKNTLKGKGVIFRVPSRDGVGFGFRGQNDIKPARVTMVASDASLSSRTVVPPPHVIAGPETEPGPDPDSSNDGVSLREWLIGRLKVNKIESMCIFRQIVDLVNSCHSQGIALQDLRPSYFKLLPSNHVRYIGFSAQKELQGSVMDQDVSHLENQQTGKRPLEQGLFPSIGLNAKKLKFSQNLDFVRRWPQLRSRSGFKLEAANAIGINMSGPQDSGYEFIHPNTEYNTQSKAGSPPVCGMVQQQLTSRGAQLEKKWYTSPEEVSEGGCTISANIYCLGVLLFELLGSFDSPKALAAAMLDLHHRILPPNFLSENPKEAGFCLWLLHPEPSSRPTTRKILESEVISGFQEVHGEVLSSSIDQEDNEAELLLHFLMSSKEQKEVHSSKLVEDVRCLEADIEEVEKRHSSRKSSVLSCSQRDSLNARDNTILHKELLSSEVLSQLDPISYTNDLRVMKNFSQLEDAYFSMRSKIQLPETDATTRSDRDLLKNRENWFPARKDEERMKPTDRLGAFFDGLCKYARYSKFEVRGILRSGDFMNSANVICSLSFDRDEDYFAAAGVSKKIKIFEFCSLFNDSVDIHCPVIEMSNKSRLSCICWNNYIKNYLASTDYDGVVKLWDVSTGQVFSHYIEHQRRAWSVDFSQVDPTKLASGSDDCSKNCLGTIKNIANVCCVQFSAHATNLLAFGSADFRTYCYDLRNTKIPWCILDGHKKAVSHVRFVDSETLVSASTDNTLKLWDLNKTSSNGLSTNACSLTLSGHTNEKNFVGLSIADGYIACGSETNEVYAYYKSLPMPIASHKFGSIDPISGKETDDDNGSFVSSVCWRGKSDMVIAANSTGCIKVLQMV